MSSEITDDGSEDDPVISFFERHRTGARRLTIFSVALGAIILGSLAIGALLRNVAVVRTTLSEWSFWWNTLVIIGMLLLMVPFAVFATLRDRKTTVISPTRDPDPAIQNRIDELSKEIRQFAHGRAVREVKELEASMAALRNAEIHSRLARQEIAVEANVFAAEASQYSRRALLWLAATFIPAGLIAVISLGTYLDPQPVGENELASFISSRVLLFSLLITVLVWCIGNYRSNYHNFVVNRHRALSLGPYIRIQSVLSETNRNDLLTEVVRSIISPQTSGYAWHDGSSPPLNLVNQIARDVEK